MGEEPAKETEMAQPVGTEGNPGRMVCSRSQVASRFCSFPLWKKKENQRTLRMTLVSCGILLRNYIWYYVCEMQSSAQEAIDEFALDQVIKDAPSEPLSLHVAFVTNRIVRVIGIISKQRKEGESAILCGNNAAVEVSLWQWEWTFLPGLTCFLNAGSTGCVLKQTGLRSRHIAQMPSKGEHLHSQMAFLFTR